MFPSTTTRSVGAGLQLDILPPHPWPRGGRRSERWECHSCRWSTSKTRLLFKTQERYNVCNVLRNPLWSQLEANMTNLNITWNQWCGVCLIVCLCAQSQVELDSMRTNRSYSVEVQAVSYWGQTQFKGPRAVLHFTTQQSTETCTRHGGFGFFSSSSKFCREEKKTSSCRLKISLKCKSMFRCLGSHWKLPPFV